MSRYTIVKCLVFVDAGCDAVVCLSTQLASFEVSNQLSRLSHHFLGGQCRPLTPVQAISVYSGDGSVLRLTQVHTGSVIPMEST